MFVPQLIQAIVQCVVGFLRLPQLMQGMGTLEPARRPLRVKPHQRVTNLHAVIPLARLGEDVHAHLQHVRVAAQFRFTLLQLIKRRHVGAQLLPAMGGLEVVAVGWGEVQGVKAIR